MKKVKVVRFHQSLYAPGAGELGNVLPPQGKTLDHLEMTYDASGLYATFSYKGIKTNILVPSANIVVMSIFEE